MAAVKAPDIRAHINSWTSSGNQRLFPIRRFPVIATKRIGAAIGGIRARAIIQY